MIYIKKIITIILLFFSITSCVEKYFPLLDKYECALVVDGMLTNGIDPVYIKLSYSSPINDQKLIPACGGKLYITDENQMEISLFESEPGTYKTMDSIFRGQVGNSYQLHINMPDGKKYLSEICRLTTPSPIDSVYGLKEIHNDEISNKTLFGIQYYIDNHSPNINDTCYYLWRLSQTFKYEAAYTLDYIWEGEFIPFPNPDSLQTCWYTEQIKDNFVFSTNYFGITTIKKFPLKYVSTESKCLSTRYSLLVKQLSISKDVFDFYITLEQQNSEQGEFYSEQPIQVRGNVYNITDSEEPVLGYFIVAGISEKRIYTDRPKLPFFYYICHLDVESMNWISYMHESHWPIYLTQIGNRLAMGTRNLCFDCRLEGGSLTKPDFWED